MPGGVGPERHKITVNGLQREYVMFVPTNRSFNASSPAPLVLNFHGWTWDGEKHMNNVGMNFVSEEKGFIAVLPDGMDDNPTHHWRRRTATTSTAGADTPNRLTCLSCPRIQTVQLTPGKRTRRFPSPWLPWHPLPPQRHTCRSRRPHRHLHRGCRSHPVTFGLLRIRPQRRHSRRSCRSKQSVLTYK